MTEKTFKLDPFQEEATKALLEGVSVVVSAPTGAGKTAIAEFVIEEALKSGEDRLFYTTPLKALTNQKFLDFKKKYGEDKVGILTGDTAINRDAQIVIMTTEIYRNMLYGTTLGSIDENLRKLRYLVLDECHYMNDPDRGTVWEECIIYSPKEIQILGLSATIANADDLTKWIEEVHGNTKLIESDFRPVPLSFYYYKENYLVPLLTTDKKLNPNLKIPKDSRKSGRVKYKDRERLKGKFDSRSSIAEMLRQMNSKGFLPAIYFVFSRRGCEIAMKECKELGFSLLTFKERDELSKIIQEKTHGNDYLFRHKHLGFLYQGIAVHHAGLLPQWKELVEFLYSKGLVKVVFATETLAAGINMPCKTTVISNLSKRGNDGHQDLSSNQFLQMSGRAGRRGMDEIGHVVVKETTDHSPRFAAGLATSEPDPLISQFTPNYSMALNLLQNHSMDQIQDLLSKSFGQYLINQDLENRFEERGGLDKKLDSLSKYPCPDPKNPGDIKVFRKQDEKIHELNRLLDVLHEQKNPDTPKFEKDLKAVTDEHESFPCFNCSNIKKCHKMEKDHRRFAKKKDTLLKVIENGENFYWSFFLRVCTILEKLSYIEKNIPTDKGFLASSLRGENILLIAEILSRCDFSNLTPEEFAGCISSIVVENVRPRTFSRARCSDLSFKVQKEMGDIARDLLKLQRQHGIEVRTGTHYELSGLVEYWCHESTTWNDLLKMTNLDEGDIIRVLRRTQDLLRHIKNAPHIDANTNALAKLAYEFMDKVPVKEEI